MSSEQQRMADEILCYLNAKRIRATYGAVGGVIGIPAQSVGKYLGNIRPKASWVVRKKDGLPTGYSEQQFHSRLRDRSHVIVDGDELRVKLQHKLGPVDQSGN